MANIYIVDEISLEILVKEEGDIHHKDFAKEMYIKYPLGAYVWFYEQDEAIDYVAGFLG